MYIHFNEFMHQIIKSCCLKHFNAFISLQFADMFLPIPVGGTVYFADSNAIEVSTFYIWFRNV